jgi:GT2 family glycosyltransferase
MPKVYIVLLNFNGTLDTIECLESLLKLAYKNVQIIVVDNSPSSTPFENLINWANGLSNEVETQFDELVYPLSTKPLLYKALSEDELYSDNFTENILFVKAKQNRGFSAGNNIALQYIKEKGEDNSLIWLLNNDTVVPNDSLSHLVSCFLKNDNNGIVGSTLVYYDNPNIIQSVGGKFNTKFYITSHILEGKKRNEVQIESKIQDYIVGASMCISKNFLETIGLLDEEYFLYYEEVDWAFRAKKLGLINYNCPESIVYHKEGKSIGSSYNYKERSFFSEKQIFISRKRFIKKHLNLSFRFYFSTLLLILNRLRRAQFKIAWHVFKVSFLLIKS